MTQHAKFRQFPIADAVSGTRHVFVRELAVPMSIGIHAHERAASQTVIVSLDMMVRESGRFAGENINDVVCYERIVTRVREICAKEHIDLVETLAERIASACLEDKRVLGARVRIEKPDAFPDCRAVGIEIERLQGH